jgi:parallel beta-helix repeat protein
MKKTRIGLSKTYLVAGLLVLTVMPATRGQAQAQSTAVTTCGQTLGAAGEYYLAGDLGPCSGDGVVITADGVHFTLAGHTISGLSSPASCDLVNPQIGVDIRGPVSDVRVNGGTVSGFVDGIDLNFASKSRVDAMTVAANCVFGIAVGNSDGIVVATNAVTTSGGDGIGIGRSHDVVVRANDVSQNTRAGIDISDFAEHNTIRNNVLDHNGGDGVAVFNGNNNTIRGNAANYNNSGIRLASPGNTGNVAFGNTANGNVSTGIWIIAGGTLSVVRKNIAFGNGQVDLYDGNPQCDSNTWMNNTFATDQVVDVSDGGPGVGCIQ